MDPMNVFLVFGSDTYGIPLVGCKYVDPGDIILNELRMNTKSIALKIKVRKCKRCFEVEDPNE